MYRITVTFTNTPKDLTALSTLEKAFRTEKLKFEKHAHMDTGKKPGQLMVTLDFPIKDEDTIWKIQSVLNQSKKRHPA
jgi:hypothetical protein